jgi:hypothetical protein
VRGAIADRYPPPDTIVATLNGGDLRGSPCAVRLISYD